MKTQEQRSRFAVSYPEGGAFLVASLVGQYIIEKYRVTGKSSVEAAFNSSDYGFHPLVPTHLNFDGNDSFTNIDTLMKVCPEQKFLIKRDPVDCLASRYIKYTENHGDLPLEHFLSEDYMTKSIRDFDDSIKDIDFCDVFYYENLTENPESVITKILHRCIGELNNDSVDLAVVDFIINSSNIKSFRKDISVFSSDSVGISENIFTPLQIERIKINLS
jgi:hypothetical protein